MGQREFCQWVHEDGGADVPQWILNVASDEFVERGRLGRDQVEECIRLARRFATGLQAEQEKAGLTSSPSLRVTSRGLAEKIRPQVEGLRRVLFRTSNAPFRSLDEAANWIETQAPKTPRLTGRDLERAENLMVEAQLRLDAYSQLVGHETHINELIRRLPYLKPGAQRSSLAHVEVEFKVRPTALGQLERDSRKLADATAFPQEAVVAYILAGLTPSLPVSQLSVTYRRLGERPTQVKSAVIETFSRGLTLGQLRNVHSRIRSTLNVGRVRPLREVDESFIELLQRCKAESKSGEAAKDFWERVRVRWNEQDPDRPYQGWRGLEMRARRLEKRHGLHLRARTP